MMIEIRNVDDCEYSDKHGMYGGMSGLKDGLVIDGENWLVKYPKNAQYLARHEEMEYTTDPISEYITSHIYKELGYPVHETMLVERHGKIAVACKDFCEENQVLMEIRTIKNSANRDLAERLERDFNSTGSTHSVNIEEILLHLEHNDILKDIPGIKERFWDMLIIDIYTNNNDRNNGNWGVIREKGHPDKLAPIFDNGGSLNGKTPDSRLSKLLENENVLSGSIVNGITSFCRMDTKPIAAKEILQYDNNDLKEAIIQNVPLIRDKADAIRDIINSIPDYACSQVRKQFYNETLSMRYEKLLVPAYERCIAQMRCIDDSKRMNHPEKEVTHAINLFKEAKENTQKFIKSGLSVQNMEYTRKAKELRKEARDTLKDIIEKSDSYGMTCDEMKDYIKKQDKENFVDLKELKDKNAAKLREDKSVGR